MKIGIIGAGNIGSALARHFTKLHHTVLIANSRGPETLSGLAREIGASAVPVRDAAKGVDLLVIAIPMKSVPLLPKDLLTELPESAVVLDTGNYYPSFRDGSIEEIEGGLTESEWVSRQLKRPVIKVFNNIIAQRLADGGLPKGAAGRIALPVAGDDPRSKQIVISLLDDLGFDGLDAGTLAQSWRQEPGTPAYGTDFDLSVLPRALQAADRSKSASIREASFEKMRSLPPGTTAQEMVRRLRSEWAKAAQS